MSGWQRLRLLQIGLLLPSIALALRLLGLRRTLAILARLSPETVAVPRSTLRPPPDRSRDLAAVVRLAAGHAPIRAACLEQSLTLWFLLRRAGFDPDLRIGVHKRDERLAAHAWVELAGDPLNDDPAVGAHFTPLSPVGQGRAQDKIPTPPASTVL